MMDDPYFALLEHPGLRIFDIKGATIEHMTELFDQVVYEKACLQSFPSIDDAYAHWLVKGRRQGLEYAVGKDTLLKVVLKAKDEFELIDLWITYHARIVGYENIIVMDCGSTDPLYIAKLATWSRIVLVLRYDKFYNLLHATLMNKEIFSLLADNAKYITILDADEFLFGRSGLDFSPSFVKDALRESEMKVVCGIWVPCQFRTQDEVEDIPTTWSVNITLDTIKGCSFAGKAIVLGSNIFPHEVLGHNLHHIAAYDYVEDESFGKIFVMHLTLPSRLKGRRSLKKVLAHFSLKMEDDVIARSEIMKIAENDEVPLNIRQYAKEYLATSAKGTEHVQLPSVGTVDILSYNPQHLPLLSKMVDDIDFCSFIQTSRDIVSSWPASQERAIRNRSE